MYIMYIMSNCFFYPFTIPYFLPPVCCLLSDHPTDLPAHIAITWRMTTVTESPVIHQCMVRNVISMMI